ncbi:unnamed protein product [Clavelina lepadiformis]|uniref:Uncharacterized protein n=1 Tax=Clavelina lepadiformis TaxID=159417 RepID=A0ABP0F8E0_CLALP
MQNLPEQWNQATHFFDLPDFLTFKATNSLSRSSCSLVSKWTYSAHDGWDKDFWTKIGLDEIVNNNFYNIGPVVLPPGDPVGEGLTSKAAAEMVLQPHTPVGASLIDAHCGGIGTIGVNVSDTKLPCVNKPLTERIAIICGTSSCHMAVSF